jgi:hypothetical protein
LIQDDWRYWIKTRRLQMDTGIAPVLATVWDGARAADLEDVTLDFKTVGRSIGDAASR